MTARSLGGKEVAAGLRAAASEALSECGAAGITVRLAIVVATREESAAWYVRSLGAAAARLGIEGDVSELPPDATAADITAVLGALSADAGIAGIVLQTPLPAGLAAAEIASAIDPAKDVDGANPVSLGRLMAGLPASRRPPRGPSWSCWTITASSWTVAGRWSSAGHSSSASRWPCCCWPGTQP